MEAVNYNSERQQIQCVEPMLVTLASGERYCIVDPGNIITFREDSNVSNSTIITFKHAEKTETIHVQEGFEYILQNILSLQRRILDLATSLI